MYSQLFSCRIIDEGGVPFAVMRVTLLMQVLMVWDTISASITPFHDV